MKEQSQKYPQQPGSQALRKLSWVMAHMAVSAVAALAVSLWILPNVARATPQDLFGYGARGQALGMTGTSYADNFEATYWNPAGLSRAKRQGIFMGLQGQVMDVRLDGSRFPVENGRGMIIGFHLPVPFGGGLKDRLVLGTAFFTPMDALVRTDVRFNEVAQFPILDRTQATAVQIGLGVNLNDVMPGLRAGVSASVIASVVGDLFIQLDDTNAFSTIVESELTATYAPSLGLTLDREDHGFGLVYRHRLDGRLDLNVMSKDLPVTVPDLSVSGIVHYDPGAIMAEAYWKPNPNTRWIAHMTTRLWQHYPGAQARTSASSNLMPDPKFRPTVSPRIAVEQTQPTADERVQLQLRAGYALEPTPAPPAKLAPLRAPDGSNATEGREVLLEPLRYFDNVRHVLTGGMGVKYDISTEHTLFFDVFGQFHWLQPRKHGVGETNADPGQRSSGVILGGGWTMGIEFQ